MGINNTIFRNNRQGLTYLENGKRKNKKKRKRGLLIITPAVVVAVETYLDSSQGS